MNRRVSTIVLLVCVVFVSSPLPVLAVELWYDFEGDSGLVATDKLTSDGAQDGQLENNVSIQSTALFGAQAANFDIPSVIGPVNPPFSTFEVAESTMLGDAFTVALHANNQDAVLDFTRLFTSYRGTGAVGNDRVLLDYDPTGSVIPGLRAIVNNTVVQTASPPAGMADPGYHHYALTVDSGDVRIYFDGAEVAAGNVGTGYSNSANLHIGEDPHDGGGTANEQFIGSVDEVLVINHALPAADVASLASGAISSVVTPGAGEYAVYYDFEGDLGDRFASDGTQDAFAHQNATLDSDPANARLGNGSGMLGVATSEGSPFSRIAVGPLGNLGDQLTMSAAVTFPQAGHDQQGLTRLFSTFQGSGSPAGRLIFDFNPDADVADIGVRVILPDGTATVANDTLALNERHTLTATYDSGQLRVYLDGTEVATADTSGDVDLGEFPLFIGEDNGGAVNENFIGTLDDAFIIGRALSPAEVMLVHQQGAAAVIPEPSSLVLMLSVLPLFGLWRRSR